MSGDRIDLKNIEVFAHVGDLPSEREKGQTFYLDLGLEQGYIRAAESDNLEHSVNYAELALRAKKVAEGSRRHLIEALAEDIAEDLLRQFPRLLAVEVCVHKPFAPIPLNFGDVVLSLRRQRYEEAIVAFGSNLGDRAGHIRLAASKLGANPAIHHFRLSRLYESLPWGKTDQPGFLNAAAIFQTELSPWELLRLCQQIEEEAGRVRSEKWGPRTLDLDIIRYGDFESSDPELLLPHPYARERDFVMLPIQELTHPSLHEAPVSEGIALSEDRALLVIDCQNDFISGSLACQHAEEALQSIIAFVNAHPHLPVYYSADWHSPENQSFRRNGGIWPNHCVAGSEGAELSPLFCRGIVKPSQRPGKETVFYKGKDDVIEEYSAFEARREDGALLRKILPKKILISGIASEFCVRESCLAFHSAGFDVTLLAPLLGWVDETEHRNNLKDLEGRGIRVIRDLETNA